MPVYNEQASVGKVVEEWFAEVSKWTQDFVFFVLDDGSTDGTARVLRHLRARLGPRLEVVRHENRGHGQSCLQGYRAALEARARYILQIDSDGQCDPQHFSRFWQTRADHDVIYGDRRRRDDGWWRTLASGVVRVLLRVFFRVDCVDANVPYRLMRTAALRPALGRIPADFVLANVALSVLLRKDSSIRHGSVPIRFRARYGGEPSVRFNLFAGKALQLFRQLKSLFAQPEGVDGAAPTSG